MEPLELLVDVVTTTSSPLHVVKGEDVVVVPEATKTERDPTKFRYNNNIFSLDYMEWRTRGGDYIYQ